LSAAAIAASAASAETKAFERAAQQYEKVKDTKDLVALEASRDEIQSIARGGGARAGDAQRLVAEIIQKLLR